MPPAAPPPTPAPTLTMFSSAEAITEASRPERTLPPVAPAPPISATVSPVSTTTLAATAAPMLPETARPAPIARAS